MKKDLRLGRNIKIVARDGTQLMTYTTLTDTEIKTEFMNDPKLSVEKNLKKFAEAHSCEFEKIFFTEISI